jgi:hypothetical protein
MNIENSMRSTSKLTEMECILDASVFSSHKHCNAILKMGDKCYISDALFRILFEDKDIYVRGEILKHFGRRGITQYPHIKYDLRTLLVRYEYKKKYVEDILPLVERLHVHPEIKHIILDQYSFLKEHSIILMATKKFAFILHKCGIPTLDAMNKFCAWKKDKFKHFEGVKWFLGFLSKIGTIGLAVTQDIPSAIMAAIGETLFALMDP